MIDPGTVIALMVASGACFAYGRRYERVRIRRERDKMKTALDRLVRDVKRTEARRL